MKIERSDFDAVAADIGLDKDQVDEFWRSLGEKRERHPRFDTLHVVLYYLGALLVIGAVAWVMAASWDLLGAGGILTLAATTAVLLFAIGRTLWHRGQDLRIPGGLLITAAVATVPLLTYALQDLFGLWPDDPPGAYRDFHHWIQGGWPIMELATIAAGLIAVGFYRFAFLTAPVALALWYLSMDLTPIIFDTDPFSWRQRQLVSLWFGLAMLAVAYAVDMKARRDFAFWLYLFGLMAFWGGLSLMNTDSELARLGYLLVNVVLIGLSLFLRRRAFIVFGGIGVFRYIAELAYRVFDDVVLFPIALILIGLSLVFVGVRLQRDRTKILAWTKRTIPVVLKQFRPKR
jgi:hypothetical protein